MDASIVFDPSGCLAKLIKHKARKISHRPGMSRSDAPDLAQIAWVGVVEALPSYDPSRGSLMAFLASVVENALASHLRWRFAEMRSPLREECSLNEMVRDPEGNLVERHELIEAAGYDPTERIDREFDVATVLARMPDDLRAVAITLAHGTVHSTSKALGISRPAVERAMEQIRVVFEDADLRAYL